MAEKRCGDSASLLSPLLQAVQTTNTTLFSLTVTPLSYTIPSITRASADGLLTAAVYAVCAQALASSPDMYYSILQCLFVPSPTYGTLSATAARCSLQFFGSSSNGALNALDQCAYSPAAIQAVSNVAVNVESPSLVRSSFFYLARRAGLKMADAHWLVGWLASVH